jgi:hypothetical protein
MTDDRIADDRIADDRLASPMDDGACMMMHAQQCYAKCFQNKVARRFTNS